MIMPMIGRSIRRQRRPATEIQAEVAPGASPTGTQAEYEEGIDIDQTKLNGGAPSGDDGVNSINPAFLSRNKECLPVYPWNYVRTNTVYGIIHSAGGYTAWSDKHPSYSSIGG